MEKGDLISRYKPASVLSGLRAPEESYILVRMTSLNRGEGHDGEQIAQIAIHRDIELTLLPQLRFFISQDIKTLTKEHDADADRFHIYAQHAGPHAVIDIEKSPVTLNSIYMRAGTNVRTDYYLIDDKGGAQSVYTMEEGLEDYNPELIEMRLRQILGRKMPGFALPANKLGPMLGRAKGFGF